MDVERSMTPARLPLPPETEVPCSECGAPTREQVETFRDAFGWIIGRRTVLACYSCGHVEEVEP